jgi:hypothetical protein
MITIRGALSAIMSTTLRYALLQPDGNLLKASILGRGGTAVTVRDGDAVLKLPLKYGLIGPDGTFTDEKGGTTQISYDYLHREKNIFTSALVITTTLSPVSTSRAWGSGWR